MPRLELGGRFSSGGAADQLLQGLIAGPTGSLEEVERARRQARQDAENAAHRELERRHTSLGERILAPVRDVDSDAAPKGQAVGDWIRPSEARAAAADMPQPNEPADRHLRHLGFRPVTTPMGTSWVREAPALPAVASDAEVALRAQRRTDAAAYRVQEAQPDLDPLQQALQLYHNEKKRAQALRLIELELGNPRRGFELHPEDIQPL